MARSFIYKGVYTYKSNGVVRYFATKTYNGKRIRHDSLTERDAAIAYDKICIEFGLPPVNILKHK